MRVPMRRFIPPWILGLVIVGLAPYMGKLQKLAKDTLENQQLVQILTLAFVAGAVAVVAAILRASRRAGGRAVEERAPRGRRTWFWIVAGCSLIAVQIALSSRGSASAAAYERLHFILYGLLAILFYRAFLASLPRSWSILGAGASVLGVSLLDEGVQWLVPLRTGEFFDLGLNLYGGVAGLLIAQALPASSSDEERGEVVVRRLKRSVALLLGAVLLVGLLFVDSAHLGYRIDDVEIGSFHSFFTREQLVEENKVRTVRWSVKMPQLPLRKALQVEDYFLTEAGWHVLLRNRARSQGETATVWHETRILERYFGASLEIPDGNDWFRYRLPESERLALNRIEPTNDYLSTADNGRIWPAPRGWLVLGLFVSLGSVGFLYRRTG